jgi:hypothetical protein
MCHCAAPATARQVEAGVETAVTYIEMLHRLELLVFRDEVRPAVLM